MPISLLQSIAASTPGLKYLTSEAEMLSEDSQSPSAFRERMKRRSTSVSGLASAEKTRGRPHRLLTTRERNASRKRLGFAIEVRSQCNTPSTKGLFIFIF